MQHMTLLSEGFERAARDHKRALENFKTDDFTEAVRIFERTVSTMVRVMGMQAENDRCKCAGQFPTHNESDFANA